MPDAEFYEQILQVHAKRAANGIHLPAPFLAAEPQMTPNPDQIPWSSAMMQALTAQIPVLPPSPG
jgi:hypothetical protein